MQQEYQKYPEYQKYYVPAQSPWPIVGAVALFLIAVGAGNFVIEATRGESGYGGYILPVSYTHLTLPTSDLV